MSRLVHVGVRASNLEKSIRFWRDLLGLTVVGQGENHYDLTDGRSNFRVFQHTGPERPPNVGGMLDYLHIGVLVPDLKEAYERFVAAGVPIVVDDVYLGKPYDPNHPPQESFKVADPDGIVIDISANPDQWPGVSP